MFQLIENTEYGEADTPHLSPWGSNKWQTEERHRELGQIVNRRQL